MRKEIYAKFFQIDTNRRRLLDQIIANYKNYTEIMSNDRGLENAASGISPDLKSDFVYVKIRFLCEVLSEVVNYHRNNSQYQPLDLYEKAQQKVVKDLSDMAERRMSESTYNFLSNNNGAVIFYQRYMMDDEKKKTGKVVGKKTTIKINLPPKPSAAPTIRLPTLPPR